MSAAYRVRQFIDAARAVVLPRREEDVELPALYLSQDAMRLFGAMPVYDRQHAVRVVLALRDRGHTGPDLMAAALLHDVGKTAQRDGALRLWHRVAVVLLRAVDPALLSRIAQDRAGSWRRPFFVQQHHAALGAEEARRVGCSPRTVALILHHEDPFDLVIDPALAALQAADGAS